MAPRHFQVQLTISWQDHLKLASAHLSSAPPAPLSLSAAPDLATSYAGDQSWDAFAQLFPAQPDQESLCPGSFLDLSGSVRGPSLFDLCIHPPQHHPHGIIIFCLSPQDCEHLSSETVSPQHPAPVPHADKPLITILIKEHLNKRNKSKTDYRTLELKGD